MDGKLIVTYNKVKRLWVRLGRKNAWHSLGANGTDGKGPLFDDGY